MTAEQTPIAHPARSASTSWRHDRPVVVMGVSGVGKTTVGRLLAERLGRGFVDADDLHDDRCKEKMARGEALTDADRLPWLDRVGEAMRQSPVPLVVACSALRYAYRARLRRFVPDVCFVHLRGPAHTIAERLGARRHEYMSPALLDSQIETLEPLRTGENGVDISISSSPAQIVDRFLELTGEMQESAQRAVPRAR